MTREHGKAPAIETNHLHGETVSELVRRHLNDQSHQTTEEELRNAILDLSVAGSEQMTQKFYQRHS